MRGLERLQPYCHKPVPGQYGEEAASPEQWSLKHALYLYFSVLRDKPFPLLFKLVWADIAVIGTVIVLLTHKYMHIYLCVYVVNVKIPRKG